MNGLREENSLCTVSYDKLVSEEFSRGQIRRKIAY
jgi:hypothetical protein